MTAVRVLSESRVSYELIYMCSPWAGDRDKYLCCVQETNEHKFNTFKYITREHLQTLAGEIILHAYTSCQYPTCVKVVGSDKCQFLCTRFHGMTYCPKLASRT